MVFVCPKCNKRWELQGENFIAKNEQQPGCEHCKSWSSLKVYYHHGKPRLTKKVFARLFYPPKNKKASFTKLAPFQAISGDKWLS